MLQVGPVDDPTPGPGEVLVRVAASGVNPTDWKRRAGQRGPLPFPRMIPGYDAAGTVEAVGEDVHERPRRHARLGLGGRARQDGTARRPSSCSVPASRAVPLPDGVSFEEGACLGVPAIDGLSLADARGAARRRGRDRHGRRGRGLQLCRPARQGDGRARARASSAGGEDREEDASRAGADLVVNTDRDDLRKAALDFTEGEGARCLVDVDLGAHLDFSWRITAQNGTIASFGSATNPRPMLDWPKFMYRNIAIRGVAIFEVPEPAKLAAAGFVQKCLEEGRLWHRIDRRFPLDDIAAAHRHQETGRPRGKIIVLP